ncbi:hypothetical protein ACFQE1_09235 [Halobium palmae]|uniref:Methanogenesis regulatory protein FilR1 middle domain-containing protein n=1 Tax=Halobium palmae TaxID=1776492 RepID=A0ABD5RYT5_9EURY
MVGVAAGPDVLDALPDLPEIGDRSLADVDGLALYESDRGLPYALWLMETADSAYAGITAYDGTGVAGVLVNDSDAAVDWAEDLYRRYRRTARPVPSVPTSE